MTTWAHDALFYHVYPLGLCGAPATGDPHGPPVPRLLSLLDWLPHYRELGVTALYLGPVFASSSHGYDTVDYLRVDPRLGTARDLRTVIDALHQAGIRVILDAVYNHTSRAHPAFQDLLTHGREARHAAWYRGVRWDRRSPLGDPFAYDTWAGVAELPRLDVRHPEVVAHLLAATRAWFQELDIDGLRLDAADCLDEGFLRALVTEVRAVRPDAYLLGEIVKGDYRRWTGPGLLDAVTNYEAYKGLHSSLNSRNAFEIAHTLERQFGPGGIYRALPLYAFVDNHDVNRIASTIKHRPHLYPLHLLLFTMPGVPSLYYGSEWAVPGKKERHSDAPLRPSLRPEDGARHDRELAGAIARLARMREALPALRHGDYRQLHVANEQLAFLRTHGAEQVLVALNASDAPVAVEVPVEHPRWRDMLDPGEVLEARNGRLRLDPVPPTWGRVLIPA